MPTKLQQCPSDDALLHTVCCVCIIITTCLHMVFYLYIFFYTGDNLQTAVTVGKNSGMIPDNSDIILLEACEPEKDLPASLTWNTIDEKQVDGNPLKPKVCYMLLKYK